jgi:Na+/melibiose symporter-like transporter
MKPTRPSALAVAGLACVALTWLLLRVVYNSLPPLPWTGIPALVFVAFAEAWSGRGLRRRILGREGTKPPDPLFVSRMLVLAKASSMAAALIAGLTLGFIGYLSGQLAAATPRNDIITAGITCAAALLLVAAALYLEFCCRVPEGRIPGPRVPEDRIPDTRT